MRQRCWRRFTRRKHPTSRRSRSSRRRSRRQRRRRQSSRCRRSTSRCSTSRDQCSTSHRVRAPVFEWRGHPNRPSNGAPGDSVDSVESTDSNIPTSSSQESLDSQKTSTPNSQLRLLAQTSSIPAIPGYGHVRRKWTLKSQLSENGVPESLEMGSWSQNSAAFDVSAETLCMGCREDMA